MTAPREGAVGIEMLRNPADGRTFVAVDSLVDLFAELAGTYGDGPVKSSMENLAASFRPMSTYAELEATVPDDDDGTVLQARRCSCGSPVIDAKRIAGTPVVVDANPVPDGPLFPVRIDKGVPTVAPWKRTLDGLSAGTQVRLAEHVCTASA